IRLIRGSQSRQGETELRSTPFFRIEIDASAVLLDHFPHKRESQTCRLFVLLLSFTNNAIELVPHALLRLRGNPETTIFNAHAHTFSLERRRYCDSRSLRTVFDRV